MAKKRGFMDGYKTYDTSEGYGNPSEWRDAFGYRMGFDKAVETLGNKDPFETLGVSKTATWDEIKTAHRKMVMKYHPDRNPGQDEIQTNVFKAKQAAFEILEKRFKR